MSLQIHKAVAMQLWRGRHTKNKHIRISNRFIFLDFYRVPLFIIIISIIIKNEKIRVTLYRERCRGTLRSQ